MIRKRIADGAADRPPGAARGRGGTPAGGSGTLDASFPSVPKGHLATSLELTLAAASFAESKNARDIVILDMQGLVSYTDYLIVCTGSTPRQTKAIADEVRVRMKDEHGAVARKVEGAREGEWILIDLLDVVVHVFTPEARQFYRLDRLWREAPRQAFAAASA